MGNKGARSSGPTGCPVPGCSTGGGGVGRSCSTWYHRDGISLSASWNLCCFTCDMVPPRVTSGRSETSGAEEAAHLSLRVGSGDGSSDRPCRRGDHLGGCAVGVGGGP